MLRKNNQVDECFRIVAVLQQVTIDTVAHSKCRHLMNKEQAIEC